MKLIVKCSHGVETTLDGVDLEGAPSIRRLVRNVLLACPECRYEATKVLEDVGE